MALTASVGTVLIAKAHRAPAIALVALAVFANPQGCKKTNHEPPRIDWVELDGGTFLMGANDARPDESPAHEVELTAFSMARTEATVAEYRACVEADVCTPPSSESKQCSGVVGKQNTWTQAGRDRYPVNCIDWQQAHVFCRWLGGHLPSEAQWEYAARADTSGARYGAADDIAWHSANANHAVHPVAQKTANTMGLHDTLGNVWEWTADHYDANYYRNSPRLDPPGAASGERRVSRGGSIHIDLDVLRASYRHDERPGDAYHFLGVRCARTRVP
jgi:formylglycine-generating enzyme required for sulfatase activity